MTDHEVSTAISPQGPASSSAAVASLTSAISATRPFSVYFENLARRRFSGAGAGAGAGAHVQLMCQHHPRLYLICVALDIAVVQAPLALMAVAATGVGAYRVVMP